MFVLPHWFGAFVCAHLWDGILFVWFSFGTANGEEEEEEGGRGERALLAAVKTVDDTAEKKREREKPPEDTQWVISV